ncbi:STAS domain-containing protein [Longispora sp. NPDC051575]|uniref:STAS domain-containing protein n=1 Tax=Longispora sp. NPDC051575 TaxID=3154943 RepID=UPI00341BCE85
MRPFSVTGHLEGEDLRLLVTGDLDITTNVVLRHALDEAMTTTRGAINVDVSQVVFIDSTSLGVLVAEWKKATAAGRVLRVVGATGLVHKVLSVTGLLDTLTG